MVCRVGEEFKDRVVAVLEMGIRTLGMVRTMTWPVRPLRRMRPLRGMRSLWWMRPIRSLRKMGRSREFRFRNSAREFRWIESSSSIGSSSTKEVQDSVSGDETVSSSYHKSSIVSVTSSRMDSTSSTISTPRDVTSETMLGMFSSSAASVASSPQDS